MLIETVFLPQDSSNPDLVHEDRFHTAIFEFDDGSTIVVIGLTHYTIGEPRLTKSDPRDSAIIGGTGIYTGVRGQITITRIEELHHEYKFEILF